MIQIADNLVLPNGEPLVKATIEVTTRTSTEVLSGTFFTVCSGDAGEINFNLINGVFDIELKTYKGHVVMSETVEVIDTTPTPITLVNLVNNHKYIAPEVSA